MLYSVIIPCYKSGESLEVIANLLFDFFKQDITSYELILVNDGSPDNGETFKRIKKIQKKYANVKGIDLAKNTGQHNATLCALNYAKGDYIISMDDDLQTHPSQLPRLLAELENGNDIVYAYYPEKKHGLIRNLGSRFNSWTVHVFIGKPKTLRTSSFWIIKKFVRDMVIQYKGPYAYIQGLFLRTTNRIACVPVEHFERTEGTSGYTLKSLIKLWSNIIGFSIVPLRIASKCGMFLSFLSLVAAIYFTIRKIGWQISISGWTSVIVAICFFSGVILMFMGLIGEYIGRMFLVQNKQPQYIVREIIGGNIE